MYINSTLLNIFVWNKYHYLDVKVDKDGSKYVEVHVPAYSNRGKTIKVEEVGMEEEWGDDLEEAINDMPVN